MAVRFAYKIWLYNQILNTLTKKYLVTDGAQTEQTRDGLSDHLPQFKNGLKMHIPEAVLLELKSMEENTKNTLLLCGNISLYSKLPTFW